MADEKWLDDLKEDIIIIKETLKNMVEMNNLKLITFEEKLKVANNRIKDLEDNQKWLTRAIIGQVIAAVMAFFILKR